MASVTAALTDVEPCTDARQPGLGCDEVGEATGLVRGQCVHRVEDQRLDACRARITLSSAVIEYRHQEAFGLARACTGRDDRRRRHPSRGSRQSLESGRLMLVRNEPVGQPAKGRFPVRQTRCEMESAPASMGL